MRNLTQSILSRVWKIITYLRARFLIARIDSQTTDSRNLKLPAIILTNITRSEDFLISTYLFKDKNLMFISTEDTPHHKTSQKLKMLNYINCMAENIKLRSLFKKVLSGLEDLNRSIVVTPLVDPVLLVKIAMKANVPIVPVRFQWTEKNASRSKESKCLVHIGKKSFISPSSPELKDIFFKKRGVRKFSKLSQSELREVGRRIVAGLVCHS